jgi:hypothetical protein
MLWLCEIYAEQNRRSHKAIPHLLFYWTTARKVVECRLRQIFVVSEQWTENVCFVRSKERAEYTLIPCHSNVISAAHQFSNFIATRL